MKTVVVIPARMKSTRFPGKPLAKLLGLPMVEHVRRRCLLADSVDEVIVATCDEEIRATVAASGGRVIMTSKKHFGCTDRIAEAAMKIKADIIVNVQGDEPTVLPWMIEALNNEFKQGKKIDCVNLMIKITDQRELSDPNIIKVVLDNDEFALYFSRSTIPFSQFHNPRLRYFKQTGLYAYRKEFLVAFAELAPATLEITEGIDMLRALENGYKIKMKEILGTLIGVDTPKALRQAASFIKKTPFMKRYLHG